jgi:4-amino-4-deoxy-L-arabinose transferase-like glycosyltransferase
MDGTQTVRRSAFAGWFVLLLFLALTVFGFLREKLFEQTIWTPRGLKNFLVFSGCYALCCIAMLLWKPDRAAGILLACVLGYTVLAAGPIAPLTVGLFLLSSLVLGQSILARSTTHDNGSASTLLAMLLGLSVYMFALSLAALVPVNYPAVDLAALIAPLLLNRRATIVWLRKIPSWWRPLKLSRTEQVAAASLMLVLLLHWLVALEPEIGPDALAMHLAVPSTVALSHRWTFDVTKHLWAVMPMGANWCFTLCYLLGGESAARLFNLALLGCIVALLVSTICKWLPLAPTFLTVALFAATPLVQLVTGSLFVDNLWAMLSLGALVSLGLYREGGREQYLYLTFVLLGAAAATKALALAFLPPFGLIALWTLWKQRTPGSARKAALALACYLIIAAPPYLIAYAKTGNPVFPYLARIFPSSYGNLAAAFDGPPPGPSLSLRTPYDLTFQTSLFREVQDGATGFQYFLFMPLGILLLRRKWPDLAIFSVLTLAPFVAITLGADPCARYIYAAFPLATLFIAGTLAALKTLDTRIYSVAMALAVALFVLDLYFLPASGWMHKDFVSNPASSRARAAYVTEHAPERNLVAYLNQAHPGEPVAFFATNAIAGLRGAALTTSWHNVEFYKRVLTAQSANDCFRILHDYGVSLLIAPLPDSGIPFATTPAETLSKECTVPESTSGKFYAGRLKDTCSIRSDQPGPPVPPGEYDDFHTAIRYVGRWSHGRFANASHGTVTYSNTPGAEVILPFTGAEVGYIYTKAPNRGIAEIVLDEITQGEVDLYSSSVEWKSTYQVRSSAAGAHTLKIRVTGRKNPAATDSYVDVDGFVVHGR